MIGYSKARTLAVLAVFATPILVPAMASAQTAATTASTSTDKPAKPAKPGKSEMSVLKTTTENVDSHIALLHNQLKITPAEEAQWTQFAAIMRDNATQMEAAFSQRGQSLETMNAVQDLQSYAQISQTQSVNMQKLATGFETLYASFPPAQQKIADGVFRAKPPKHG